MKKLISILGMTTMGFNALVIPIQNITNKEETSSVKSDFKLNEQNTNITEQWYLKIANKNQATTYKDNLLSAISLKDHQVNFDLNKINKDLWNDEHIYNLISNPNYIKNLQLMYETGMLQFIDGKPQFSENDNYYGYSGIWAETKWYWFGYWKLHIGHVECQDFVAAMMGFKGSFVRIVNGVLNRLGGWISAAASAVTLVLFGNATIMKAWDLGNGI